MNPTSRARTRLVTVVSLLALATAIVAPSALAEEPAPSPEPIVAPDPSPDPAPRTAPRSKPVVKTPPARPVVVSRSEPARTRSEPARTAPAASTPTPGRAAVDVTAPRRVRHRPPPARVAKRRTAPERSEPTPARPRRELPFASFAPEPTVAASATTLRPGDPDRIDLTWPALIVLGGALAAAAAAAASAVAPSFRLALVGGLVGGLSDRPSALGPGHIERRVRRPHRPATPVLSDLPPAEPPRPLEPGIYEIEWFRGYVKSRFFVLLDEPHGESRLVESPWFSWRQAEPPPPSPDVVAARDALLANLERDGWHECGRGQAWYSQRITPGDRL